MLKKIIFITSLLTLAGCDLHKVTDKQELCNQAKRQQTFNANSPSYDSNYLMASQNQQLSSTAQADCS